MKRIIVKIYLYTLSAGFVYLAFIKLTGFSCPCIIYELTGIKCPACGITRMFLELSKLNFKQAFLYNPVVFILLTLWIFISIMIFADVSFFQKRAFLYAIGLISVFVLCGFGAYRIFC